MRIRKLKLLLILMLLLGSTTTVAEEINWYRVAANTTLAIDWLQTHEIATHDEFYETNRILGRYPSTGDVNRYFISYILLTNIIGELIPDQYSNIFYVGFALAGTKTVVDNYSLGIRINF